MSASAILTDPEAGDSPACPCHERPPAGTAYGWHERTGPLPIIRARHGTNRLYGARPRWIDHAYRLRLPDRRWAYYAEPYALDEDALADLDYLGRHGFEVTITAWRARHCPGHTLAVQIIAEVTP